MLSGRRAFRADSAVETMSAILAAHLGLGLADATITELREECAGYRRLYEELLRSPSGSPGSGRRNVPR